VPTESHRDLAIRVAGIAVDTTNAAEMTAVTAAIPGLWGRFVQEHWSERLGRVGAVGPTLAAYCEYQSDVNGRYRLLVGREIPREAPLPDGSVSVEIPSGRYVVFQFRGAPAEIALQSWQEVWTFFEGSRACQRAYTVDFETYPADGSGIDIWIAVK
jgi:predicted transcriptional regulator YdeE